MPYTRALVSAIRFDHIAIAVARMADAVDVLVGALGGAPAYGAAVGAYRFGQWRFAGGARIEILEPQGADSFLHRFLAQRGPGVHHVTFIVPSLRAACDRAEQHGYTIVGYDDSNPHWKEAFLHPREALGIVVQMAEAARGGSTPRMTLPAGPLDPPPPVRILGLRLRARSHERARVQWESVLEGSPVGSTDGRLIYRWPGSPLRLLVEIHPSQDEGPVCVEFAAERKVVLPPGRHPILGAVLSEVPGSA
jgi:methylmalonyl-CoA/ethylmalonyl-CoA epimerase